MGRKIFVSYKYADSNVARIGNYGTTTVRDYVDAFENKLEYSDNIYKGESDGEDLSKLSDDAIWEKLKDRIYDSSVTVVFISPGMKENGKSERNQWIPWEISYSLKETSRRNKSGCRITSHSNAMVAVVLPDSTGSYNYYLEHKNCCSLGCTTHKTDILFKIIRKNKFNKSVDPLNRNCDNNETVWTKPCSYIEAVKWNDFINNYQKYISSAISRQEHIDEYRIVKDV